MYTYGLIIDQNLPSNQKCRSTEGNWTHLPTVILSWCTAGLPGRCYIYTGCL